MEEGREVEPGRDEEKVAEFSFKVLRLKRPLVMLSDSRSFSETLPRLSAPGSCQLDLYRSFLFSVRY